MKKLIGHRGNTLVELLLVMGLFIVLFITSTLSLSGTRSKASLGTTVDTLIADLRAQQTKAMSGDGASSYGIHFNTASYELFKDAYATDPNRFTVDLDDVQITNSFTDSEIVFDNGSGEILGFNPLINTLRLSSVSNSANQKFIVINRLGVIENIY